MRIGLVDVDGHNKFPNLALMKLSAWHKAKGDFVEWANPMFGQYDRVYMSKVFTFTPDCLDIYNCEVVKGGTGYADYKTNLTYEQEHITPDYSLYPNFPHALGFLTRGCVNSCPWCVVPKKEGKICAHADITEFLDGRPSAICLDNNITGHPHGIAQIKKIIDLGIKVDFNQGIDARQVDEEQAELLAQVKYINYIRFAADTLGMVNIVKRAVSAVRKAGYKGDFMIYTMLHGDVRECLDRINSLLEYDKRIFCHAQPKLNLEKRTIVPQWQSDLARWASNHFIHRSTKFEDYEPRKGFTCRQYLK